MTNKLEKDEKKSIHSRTCHKHPSLVLISKGLEIYADSRQGTEDIAREFDLVISLGETIRLSPAVESEPFRRLLGLHHIVAKPTPEILYLMWPDMSVPSYSREFWVELCRILKKKGNDRARRDKKYKVIMHCFGGHGRTGTALAIMSRFIEDRRERLVERIREEYCKNSVETSGQLDYVEMITGIKDVEKVRGTKDFSHQHKPTSHSSASSGVAESNYINSPTPLTDSTLRDAKEENSLRCKRHGYENCEVCYRVSIGEIKEEDSKSNIDDYFKNRNKWRKEYTN